MKQAINLGRHYFKENDTFLTMIGTRIQNHRTQIGFTCEQLAEESGLSVQSIVKIESGTRNFRIISLVSICKALGLSTDYLLGLSDSKGEKEQLKAIVSKGTASAQTILRANILLSSDYNNKKHMTVTEMAETFHCVTGTVQKVRTTPTPEWRRQFNVRREKPRIISLK